jgi:hypothetical protein
MVRFKIWTRGRCLECPMVPTGANWCFDLHVAGMRHLPTNESERPFSQTHQARIRMAARIIDEFIEFHARIVGNTERTSISESNAEFVIGSVGTM